MEKKAAFCVLKALIAAYIMTGILLVALSFALCVLGFLYVLVLVIVSLIARGGLDGVVHGEPARLLLCLAGGALGAFLS